MEERVPPVTADANGRPEPYVDPQDNFQSGTYVVQVPKDQIYRVPPPENALIAERHRAPAQKKNSYRTICYIVCIIIIILAVAIGVVMGLSAKLLHPKNPRFHVQHFVVTNSSNSRPHFKVTLQAKNPNSRTGITYEEGGNASISFKNQKIAAGKCPSFYQSREDSSVFVIPLDGFKTPLPKEIEKSMKGKSSAAHTSLPLSLSINYPIKRKVWLFDYKRKTLSILCNITVDTLAKATPRVLSQECQS